MNINPIRFSSLGYIVSAKYIAYYDAIKIGKSPKLTINATAIEHLIKSIKKKSGYPDEEMQIKEIMKGQQLEQEAMAHVKEIMKNRNMDSSKIIQSKLYDHNKYVFGTPDFETEKAVIDVKVSWDWSTFVKAQLKENHYYKWQSKAQMFGTGRDYGLIIHVLLDTPEELLLGVKEKKYYEYKNVDFDDAKAEKFADDFFSKYQEYHTPSKRLPKEERIHVRQYSLTKEDKELIESAVIDTNKDYYNKIKNKNNEQ